MERLGIFDFLANFPFRKEAITVPTYCTQVYCDGGIIVEY